MVKYVASLILTKRDCLVRTQRMSLQCACVCAERYSWLMRSFWVEGQRAEYVAVERTKAEGEQLSMLNVKVA